MIRRWTLVALTATGLLAGGAASAVAATGHTAAPAHTVAMAPNTWFHG